MGKQLNSVSASERRALLLTLLVNLLGKDNFAIRTGSLGTLLKKVNKVRLEKAGETALANYRDQLQSIIREHRVKVTKLLARAQSTSKK